MVSSSKILTVSYGTFSCTVEGFEDPLTVVKDTTQFFRGIVKEDRFFGAEPPQFDAELASEMMRAQIAADERNGHVTVRPALTGASSQALSAALDAGPVRAAPGTDPAALPQGEDSLPSDDLIEEAARRAEAEAAAAEAAAAEAAKAETEEAEAEKPEKAAQAASAEGQAESASAVAAGGGFQGDDSIAARLQRIRDVVSSPAAAAVLPQGEDTLEDAAGDTDEALRPDPGFAPDFAPEFAPEASPASAPDHAPDHAPDSKPALAAEPAPQAAQPEVDSNTPETNPEAPAAESSDDLLAAVTAAANNTPVAESPVADDVSVTAMTEAEAPTDLTAPAAEDALDTSLDDLVAELPQAAPSAEADLSQPGFDSASLSAMLADLETETAQPQTPDQAPAPAKQPESAEIDLSALLNDSPEAEPREASPQTAEAKADPMPEAEVDLSGILDGAETTPQAEAEPDLSDMIADSVSGSEIGEAAQETVENAVDTAADQAADVAEALDTTPQDNFAAEVETPQTDTAEQTAETAEPDVAAQADAPATTEAEAPQPKAAETTAEATTETTTETTAEKAARSARKPLRARVVKVKRAVFDKAVAEGQLEEIEDDSATLSPEEEDELARELEAVKAELSGDLDDWEEEEDLAPNPAWEDSGLSDDWEDEENAPLQLDQPVSADWDRDETPQTSAETAPEAVEEAAGDPSEGVRKAIKMASPARAMLTEQSVEDDDASRILNQTNSELEEPEGNRRRSAIAHLRAAVAATRADRLLGRKADTEKEAAEPYREDLANVVRPRRPQPAARTERPAPQENARPAPLKLVAEQRVADEPAAPAPAASAPVRPRRVSIPDEPAPEGADASGFVDYADSVGARDLPELLEAAAAYMSFVEGRDQFSRPQLMTTVRMAETEDFSREDRLRSFGQLLREGKIQKTSGGRFTASDRISFKPRRAG